MNAFCSSQRNEWNKSNLRTIADPDDDCELEILISEEDVNDILQVHEPDPKEENAENRTIIANKLLPNPQLSSDDSSEVLEMSTTVPSKNKRKKHKRRKTASEKLFKTYGKRNSEYESDGSIKNSGKRIKTEIDIAIDMKGRKVNDDNGNKDELLKAASDIIGQEQRSRIMKNDSGENLLDIVELEIKAAAIRELLENCDDADLGVEAELLGLSELVNNTPEATSLPRNRQNTFSESNNRRSRKKQCKDLSYNVDKEIRKKNKTNGKEDLH